MDIIKKYLIDPLIEALKGMEFTVIIKGDDKPPDDGKPDTQRIYATDESWLYKKDPAYPHAENPVLIPDKFRPRAYVGEPFDAYPVKVMADGGRLFWALYRGLNDENLIGKYIPVDSCRI